MIGLSRISTDRLRRTPASAKEEPRGGADAFRKDWRAAKPPISRGSKPIRELFSGFHLMQPGRPNRARTKQPQKRLEKRKNADVEEKRPGQNQKQPRRTNKQSSAHSAFQRCLFGDTESAATIIPAYFFQMQAATADHHVKHTG